MPSLKEYRNNRLAPPKRLKAKRSTAQSILLATLTIVLILLFARFVTVLVLSFREDPDFIAPRTIYLPQRELDHSMAVAEFQNAAASPAQIPTLTTESLLASAPALPQIPNFDFTPAESETVATQAEALFGQSGLMGALGALSAQTSSVSFLGIREDAARFVIMIDVSDSVIRSIEASGRSMEAIRQEAQELIRSLNANTLFNIVQHSRRYDSFQSNLVPATMANKEAAIAWFDNRFRTSLERTPSFRQTREVDGMPDGIAVILDAVFDMQPDAIFMLSDGGYFTSLGGNFGRPVTLRELRAVIDRRQRDLPTNARIHFIHFPDRRNFSDDRIGGDMRRVTSATGGVFREIRGR